ncbi:MAG: polyphenol oxidase family protein [Elusimicrobia bacterium]|nr:polyphenol oxidase family protein [Elusimicrobiota bacterium]
MWKYKKGLYYESELTKYGAKNFSTTTFLGDMKNEKNRKNLLEKYFGSDAIICGEQVHNDNIKIVTGKYFGKVLPQTDGLITREKGVILAVFTADCLPVFIFDKIKKIIGLVHAGRVGLSKHIVSKAIDMFVKNFGSNSADIYAAIGPHICKQCYGIDLDALAEEQLKKAGVSNISNSKLCTYTGDFFSYRRNRTKKRMISAVMML